MAANQALTDESSHLPSSTRGTDTKSEAEKALGRIIFKTRLAKGWGAYDETTQRMAVRTWYEILRDVPVAAYEELYQRACDYQASRLRDTGQMPEMSAQLMLAQWTGQNGLKAEWRERQIKSGRVLPDRCEDCYGTGWKHVEQTDGYTGVAKCVH